MKSGTVGLPFPVVGNVATTISRPGQLMNREKCPAWRGTYLGWREECLGWGFRRGHPGVDLGPRVEAELVQDAADVAVDGALGYEQARSDLLVGQAVGDQPCDVGLPLPERPRRIV